MNYLSYFDVGKTLDTHQFKKFLLNDFIHPEIAVRMKIKVSPRSMEFLLDDQPLFNLLSEDYCNWDKIESGEVLGMEQLIRNFKVYYNQKHEDSRSNKDIYFRVLTLLDKRTGKRTLQEYINNGDFFEIVAINPNPLLDKLYRLRFDMAKLKYM